MIYGHPAFGDESVYVRFGADGSAQLARQTDRGVRPWEPLPGWWQRRGELTFRDPRTDRDFTADLSRSTLGGRWHTQTLLGGWWCTAVDPVVLPVPTGLARPKPLPRLRPTTTATPQYPLQAIREAKEGRAVTCFLVDASGAIRDPEIIELSDEIFRAPTLTALSRSRFQGWEDSRVLRPGCRSYTFELHARN